LKIKSGSKAKQIKSFPAEAGPTISSPLFLNTRAAV